MKEPKVTIEKIDKKIDTLSETVDGLAMATKRGFDAVDKRFDAVDKRFDAVDKRFEAVDKRFDKVESGLHRLTRDHEDIKLRLNNVAYRFELQELERRVILLEKKAKFA